MASHWRHCVDLTGLGIKHQTSCTDSVHLATELTTGSATFIILPTNLKRDLVSVLHVQKNALFRSFCYGMYACQLWSSYYQYSLKRVRITYNNAYRILQNIPRWVSAREAQVDNHIYTFDALLRKNAYSFVERCRFSKNILITALMNSSAFLESRFYVHYQDLLLLVGAQ